MLAILNIGPLEWIVLLAGAIMLFGGDLPSVIRKLAQFLGRLRAMASDITREVNLHDYHAPPPHRPALPPPPPTEFEIDPGAASAAPEADRDDLDKRDAAELDSAEADASPDENSPPHADDAPPPPDHSDWEPETGSDRPRELRDD